MDSTAPADQIFIANLLVSGAEAWAWFAGLTWFGQVTFGIAIFLAVIVAYAIYNGVCTWWERRREDFPIEPTSHKHWLNATRNLDGLVRLCADVYSGQFDKTDGPFDFRANLRLTGSSSGRLKEQPFCHVLARESDRYAVVVFRGTQGLRDWGTNLRFLFSPIDLPHKDDAARTVRCRVHGGFARRLDAPVVGRDKGAFESLCDILTEMDEKLGRKMPIYLAGHSLGGALAVLAAARLSAVDPSDGSDRIRAVITFGQPGMSDRAFRLHYPLHNDTHRLCAGIDVVTFLPPFVRYRHVGHQYWLHDSNARFNKTWMARIFSGFLVSVGDFSLKHWKGDHSIKKYIRELEPIMAGIGAPPNTDATLPDKALSGSRP